MPPPAMKLSENLQNVSDFSLKNQPLWLSRFFPRRHIPFTESITFTDSHLFKYVALSWNSTYLQGMEQSRLGKLQTVPIRFFFQ